MARTGIDFQKRSVMRDHARAKALPSIESQNMGFRPSLRRREISMVCHMTCALNYANTSEVSTGRLNWVQDRVREISCERDILQHTYRQEYHMEELRIVLERILNICCHHVGLVLIPMTASSVERMPIK